MAKKQPAWQIMGLDAPPPEVNGYHDYGTVYTAGQASQRESWRHAWDTATWSWSYWGKKVRRDIESVRAEGPRGPLGARALDCLALALVRLAHWLHRPHG